MPLSRLVDPVLVLLLAGAAGLALALRGAGLGPRWVRLGRALAWLSLAALWMAASPWFAVPLARSLEPRPAEPSALAAGVAPQRVVLAVLSSGIRRSDDGAPPAERLDGVTMARVLGAARWYRILRPGGVIVTGRSPYGNPAEMAVGMAELLVAHGVPRGRVHLEARANDTRENAENTVRLARSLGFLRVVVVTSATHVPRSLAEFRRCGIDAVGAPVDYVGTGPPRDWGYYLPAASALLRTHQAVHEYLGRLEP